VSFRFRAFGLSLTVGLAFLGCGDGVGRPLRAHGPGTAGNGGSSDGQGGAVSTAGAGATGGMVGVPATGGAVEVPSTQYCVPADNWSEASAASEEMLLARINFVRSLGVSCDGDYEEAAWPLTMQKELRCSARVHARDMVERDFFMRENPDQETSEERMERAGAEFERSAEVIVFSPLAPDQAFSAEEAAEAAAIQIFLVESRCRDALNWRFENVGIGYYQERWTLDFSGP
jgi:uncharacterized protein YkwD